MNTLMKRLDRISGQFDDANPMDALDDDELERFVIWLREQQMARGTDPDAEEEPPEVRHMSNRELWSVMTPAIEAWREFEQSNQTYEVTT